MTLCVYAGLKAAIALPFEIKKVYGEMAERSKATVLKTVISSDRDRGFESHSLLQPSLFELRLGEPVKMAFLLE